MKTHLRLLLSCLSAALCFIAINPHAVRAIGEDVGPVDATQRLVCCRCRVGTSGTAQCVQGITTQGDCGTSARDSADFNAFGARRSEIVCETAVLNSTQCRPVAQGGTCAQPPVTPAIFIVQNPAAPQGPAQSATSTGLSQVVPVLSVPIPGVALSPAYVEGDLLIVPFIAQYISGVYRYALTIAILLATIMIVIGGFKYVLGATGVSVSSGKDMIKDAIIGLVLLFSATALVSIINPRLARLPALRLPIVRATGLEAISPSDLPVGDYFSGAVCSDRPCTGAGCVELNVPNYKQSSTPWGPLPYGPHGALYTSANGTALRSDQVCDHSASGPFDSPRYDPPRSGAVGHACMGTFQQGACGPTSLATVLAYHGLYISIESRQILTDGAANAMHKIDPVDTAIYASVIGARQANEGMTPVAFERLSNNFPMFEEHSIQRTDANAILAAIRAAQPVNVVCHNIPLYPDEDAASTPQVKYPGGHYFVLSGIRQNNAIRIQDVGSQLKSAKLEDLMQHCSFRVVKPKANAVRGQTTSVTWSGPGGSVNVRLELRQENNAQCTALPGAGTSAPARTGQVERTSFTYRPDGARPEVWPDGQASLIYPVRLRTTPNPEIRVFIFIHGVNGGNTPADRAEYIQHLTQALNEVAGSKNIVIMTPHHNTGSYERFDVNEFYNTAVRELTNQNIMPGFRVRDVVLGGHSGSVCSDILTRAMQRWSGPPLRAAIAYDGCLGHPFNRTERNESGQMRSTWGDYKVTPENFTAGNNVSLYLAPDVGGMGRTTRPATEGGNNLSRAAEVRRLWNMGDRPIACPPCANKSGPNPARIAHDVQCFAPNGNAARAGGGELISFEINSSHNANKLEMTRIAFCALYGNTN